MLYYIPIEPLVERYTEQWYRNFPIQFKKNGFDVTIIDGEPLSNFVKDGTFLDINSTVYYKAEQIKKISKLFFEKKIKNGDIFFIADLEFWGIETIKYMADLQNIKVKIYGFLHAGSYTHEDYMEICKEYGMYFEMGWAKICNGIFVGSNYHKEVFYERRLKHFDPSIIDKVYVTGNPIFLNEYKKFDIKKKNQIIISNRFDWEKRPNISLDFAYILKRKHPEWKIIVTTSRPKFKSNRQWLIDYARTLEKDNIIEIHEGCTKDKYHELLAESKVMLTNTIEENFGYCVVETCIYGTQPLCPNKFSHPELLNNNKFFLFNSEDEIIPKIEMLMNIQYDVKNMMKKYIYAVKNMCKVIKANG